MSNFLNAEPASINEAQAVLLRLKNLAKSAGNQKALEQIDALEAFSLNFSRIMNHLHATKVEKEYLLLINEFADLFRNALQDPTMLRLLTPEF